MKAISKKTKTNYITLPKTLVTAIKSLELTSTEKSHAFKFVGLILRDSFMEYDDVFQYTPFPSNYLITTFGKDYFKIAKQLLDNKIINRSSYYSYQGLSECYSYSINSFYWLPINPLCITNRSQVLETVEYKEIVKVFIDDDNENTKYFTQDINSLTINYDNLRSIIFDKMSNLSIKDFRVNEEIRENLVCLINSEGNKYHMGRDIAIEKATKEGKVLVQDMSIFRILNADEFITNKKLSIEFSYMNSVDTLAAKAYRARRNATNMRLDTNLTNMCSALTDEICYQNDLIQIDLKNSQFTLLSHILDGKLNSDDYKLFKTLSSTGDLYDYIVKEMALEDRKEGKRVMFELMFSSRKNNTSRKALLKTIFPTVVKWIDDYKKEHGDTAFAIMLQNVESNIFIDQVYKKLKKKRIFCLTKHDSLIVRAKDEAKVMKMLTEVFTKIGLSYTLDIKRKEVVTEPIVIEKVAEKRDMYEIVSIVDELRVLGLSVKDVIYIRDEINKSKCHLGILIQAMIKCFKEKHFNDYTGPIITKEHIEALR